MLLEITLNAPAGAIDEAHGAPWQMAVFGPPDEDATREVAA